MLLDQGVHDIPDVDYHADPAREPSLSRSIAKALIQQSPLHARMMHPRLNPLLGTGSDASDEMDIGSAAHAMFLKGEDAIAVIPFASYASKEAKAQRDAARAEGRIPLKQHHYERAISIVNALVRFRDETGAFTLGKPERTLICQDTQHWSRIKVDWLPDDPAAPLWDLKTTAGIASAQKWTRAAFEAGADMQAAFYARVSEIVRGEPPAGMCFAVVEQDYPHGIRVFELGAEALEIGEAKCAEARRLWVECMASGVWPSYPTEIETVDAPPWEIRQWEYRTATRQAMLQHQQAQMQAERRDSARYNAVDKILAAGNMGG
jgi:hypothetical protein